MSVRIDSSAWTGNAREYWPNKRLTKAEIEVLEKLGWEFLPYAPNEWMWTKFDHDGNRIGSQGGPIWSLDLGIAERQAQYMPAFLVRTAGWTLHNIPLPRWLSPWVLGVMVGNYPKRVK